MHAYKKKSFFMCSQNGCSICIFYTFDNVNCHLGNIIGMFIKQSYIHLNSNVRIVLYNIAYELGIAHAKIYFLIVAAAATFRKK